MARLKDVTLVAVRARVKAMGLAVTKKDGRYRVNYIGGREDTAYYTENPEDAVGAARVMSQFNMRRL